MSQKKVKLNFVIDSDRMNRIRKIQTKRSKLFESPLPREKESGQDWLQKRSRGIGTKFYFLLYKTQYKEE